MIIDSLIKDLENSNIKRTDKVLIHSSCKSIGLDAVDILDTLIYYFKDGLLLFPTHTWGYIKNDGDVFDVKNSIPNVGILPTLFLKREGVIRSLHPTHSMAGIGNLAKEYLKGEENIDTPCSPKGVYGRLFDIDAKILLIGVNHVKNTYIHSVEESFDVKNRIAENITNFKIIDYDNNIFPIKMHKHYCTLHPHVSECYQKLDPIFLELGLEKKTKFNNAIMTTIKARDIYKLLEKIFIHELQILVEKEDIPTSFYK